MTRLMFSYMQMASSAWKPARKMVYIYACTTLSMQHYLMHGYSEAHTPAETVQHWPKEWSWVLPLRIPSTEAYTQQACTGTSVKKIEVLSDEGAWGEALDATSGVLNPDSPQDLLNCIFFLTGKNYCLREGIKHCELELSQFTREVVTINSKNLVSTLT